MSKIIYIFTYLFYVNTELIFHFNNINEYDDKSNILNNLKKNNIIINIEIGTPPQIIPSRLTFSNDFTYFKGSTLKGIYNEKISKTYKSNNESKYFINEPFKKGIYSNDIIYLKNNNNDNSKFENFSFILAEEKNSKDYDLYNGNIGLKIPNIIYFQNENFIKQLKLNNYINDYIWTIKYNNDTQGDFIIGNLPSEYDKNYKNLILKKTRAFNDGFNLHWSLYFENITWNKSEIITFETETILNIDSGVILGTQDFKDKIIDNFFQKFYSFSKCKLNIIDFEEEYFTCNKKVDITKFPSLLFFHKEFNYTFELNYKDLFLEKDGVYYFLIIFNRYQYNQWKLGKPFLKKYQFVFNQDLKYIGFYNGEIIPFKPSISKIIIFILIIIILFLFIFLICRYKNKTNKHKAQELIEDFDTDFSSNKTSYNPINESI